MIVDDLKASILNYAISGFFVKNSSDKTEDELNLLLKQKGEQLTKKEVLISSKINPIDEVPYQIPDNWKWVRIGTISKIVSKGTTPQGGKNAYKDSGVKFLRAENVKDYKVDETNIQFISEEVHNVFLKRSILEDKDLLICIAGTLGRCGIVSKENLPLNTNQAVAFVRLINNELINVRYLGYAISSPVIQNLLIDQKKITAIPNLTLEIITNCMIPLPPLEEQNRIVEKIEQLFEKLDDVKPLVNELASLKSSISSEIKKSIIDYAIHGNLSIREEKDTSCDEIIPKEDQYLENIKKFDLIIKEDEIPFSIPNSWKWVKMGMLFKYQNGYSYKPSETSKNGIGYPVIKSQNIMKRIVEINNKTSFVESPTEQMLKSKIVKGDFLMCLSSQSNNPEPLGKTAIYDGEELALLNQRVLKLTPLDYRFSKYLYYVINSFYFHNTVSHKGGGSAQSNLKLEHVMEMYIPLPPLEEQNRIVEKIEQLLPLCDDVEKLVNE